MVDAPERHPDPPLRDPAQQVWFTAWPAYDSRTEHNLVFSHWVNVPNGANLLSNTSGTPRRRALLAPVTWIAGPVTATNVALTLAPALSAWGCLFPWPCARSSKREVPPPSPPARSTATRPPSSPSLIFADVSVTVLVIPPILFSLRQEILVRQEHSAVRDGICLAALLVL